MLNPPGGPGPDTFVFRVVFPAVVTLSKVTVTSLLNGTCILLPVCVLVLAEEEIVKVELLTSVTAGGKSTVTFIRHWVEGVLGTSQP